MLTKKDEKRILLFSHHGVRKAAFIFKQKHRKRMNAFDSTYCHLRYNNTEK